MSILANSQTKVIVGGFGRQGSFHFQRMKAYGTKIVAIVSRSQKKKQSGIPVYKHYVQAQKNHQADWAVLFVPAAYLAQAALEALASGLNLVLITEGVLVHDALKIFAKAREKKLCVLGPNCPGIISPGKTKLGILPGEVFLKGSVGIVSRSGTLTYEIASQLTRANIGQSTVVGIGGDLVIGLDFVQILKNFARDEQTKAVVLIGEIGGNLEEKAAEYLQKYQYPKKIVAFIAGRTAPSAKQMGHAGAIITGKSGTAATKIKALEKAGVMVARLPSDIVKWLHEAKICPE